MEQQNVVCPVCTLFLRPGINLKQHLSTHPKQKVIEALINLAGIENNHENKASASSETSNTTVPSGSNTQNGWFPSSSPSNAVYTNFGNLSGGNHSFIYQQFMSSTTPQVPLTQQIVTVPTLLNSQMMCPPYVYQQQQVIMSGPSSVMLPKHLPIECGEKTITEEVSDIEELVEDEGLINTEEEEVKKLESEENGDGEELKIEETNVTIGLKITEMEELDKSCQTQSFENQQIENIEEEEVNYAILTNYESNLGAETETIRQENVDMDGMTLFINDFNAPVTVARVEEFDISNDHRPRVLMNIGNTIETFTVNRDESLSRESANIRADEHMPPRGELSGQESNDTSENWVQPPPRYDNLSVSYDLIGLNSEITSENNEVNEVNEVFDDTPTVSGFREPPISYKCPNCNETFNCPKERKKHQSEKHKKIKKRSKKTDENNFDNVFNRFKIEPEIDNIESEAKDNEKKEVLINPLICTLCDRVLPDSNSLKQHQLEEHQLTVEVRNKCKTCEATFPTDAKYTEHLKIHPLECRLCGKYFFRKQNMQLHMKRHLGIKPFKCNICEKSFLTKQKHDEHKNIHTGETPIKCKLCDETFRRHSNLVQHRNRHHFNVKRKLKDYVCACGEVFHSKRKLAWHKEIHDTKPKACSFCSEKFIHMASLTRHIRRAHNKCYLPREDRNSENVECPICKNVYLRNNLDVHIRSHSGQKPFTCLICNKTFSTKWNLKLHKWTHASRMSKPFKCEFCKGAFIRQSDYTAHMNSHKSVKPYTCNYCGAQFIRKYNCQRHVREHEKDKTHSCNICGKTFHRSYYLKDHIKVHSGVRPYICHICGKGSTTKSNHNKHVRIHHAREPVSAEN
nr:zinc finger protein 665-like [Onthophagus taurus]